MTAPMGISPLGVATVIGSAKVPVPPACLCTFGYAISRLPAGSLSRAPYSVTLNFWVWPGPPAGLPGAGRAGAADGLPAGPAGAADGVPLGEASGGSLGPAGAAGVGRGAGRGRGEISVGAG